MKVHLLYEIDNLARNLAAPIEVSVGEVVPPDCEILVAARPTHAQITASPHLKTLIIPFAGLPDVTRNLMLNFPHIRVHNLHHNTITAAEHALMLLLAASKRLIPHDRVFRTHDWTPRFEPGAVKLLHEKTVLILGYGAIGAYLATLCAAFGMKILKVRRTPQTADEFSPAQLPDLLPHTDILMVCVPLTPETRGMIGKNELQLLPAGAILVNIARAEVIEEAALYEALHKGHLHSAGLDVWYNYPPDETLRSHTPPSSYAFHELENVVMTPHRAGFLNDPSLEQWRMEHLAELLNAAAHGEPMSNRVNIELGY